MDAIELLVVVFVPLVVIALSWLMAWLWRRTLLLRGRRRRSRFSLWRRR
jgi:hypothetical protein